jgi:chemotaxis signal transduction protein
MSTTLERPRAQTDRGNELLSIRLGGQEFAVNIMAIREIRG